MSLARAICEIPSLAYPGHVLRLYREGAGYVVRRIDAAGRTCPYSVVEVPTTTACDYIEAAKHGGLLFYSTRGGT